MSSEAFIQTVRGPIPAESSSLTLPHEHLFINEMREQRNVGLVNDRALLSEELRRFAAVGGTTVVDVTTASLADGADPDPAGLFRSRPAPPRPPGVTRTANGLREVVALSEETGVHLIVGTGQYREPYMDVAWVDESTIDAIASKFIEELTLGMDGTDVRAGIIGEIGSNGWYVSAREERILRAAARAQRQVGASITTHSARWPIGLAQLDVLEAEGADPSRIVIGHCDSVDDVSYHTAVARRGAYVEFDAIRGGNELAVETRVRYVTALLDTGFVDQVLLSHDSCYTTHFTRHGGTGFCFIPTVFCERLRAAGVSDDDIEAMTIGNPRRMLSIRSPSLGPN